MPSLIDDGQPVGVGVLGKTDRGTDGRNQCRDASRFFRVGSGR